MIRSALFVPATRLDRIEKALASHADKVIIDLEDAVDIESKSTVRQALGDFLYRAPHFQPWIRINAPHSPWFQDDLDFCQKFDQITGIMIPKAESSEQIHHVFKQTSRNIYPLIESAKGLNHIAEIAQSKGVVQLSFGSLDLALDLGLKHESEGACFLLNQMRTQLVIQSRLAGIFAPLEGVYPNFKDKEGFYQTLVFAKGMGFGGALCIHPNQVPVIHEVMCFSEADKQWAKAVLDKHLETGLAAFSFEGKMVDIPVIAQARKILGV